MILSKRHTGLVILDLERSIRFYEALGLKTWRREKENGHFIDTVVGITDVSIEWAKLKCPDGSVVELLQYHSHPDTQPKTVAPPNRLGCSHIAFTVDDIDRTCEEIVRLGGRVVNKPALAPNNLVKVAYCHDVDGILIEVVQELIWDKDILKLCQCNEHISGQSCPVCQSEKYQIAYVGRIRDGVFGRVTDKPVNVLECVGCGLQKLEHFLLGTAEYTSNDYREKYFNTSEGDKLLKLPHPELADRLKLVAIDQCRDKIILDYGCGDGMFLDSVVGVMKHTYGIEPFKSMWPSLRSRGHEIFSTGAEALLMLRGKIDIITCFGVVEHVNDPIALIRDCYELLAPGGVLYLQTDNLKDLLMITEAKGFSDFFYRTAHNWYFVPENIKDLIQSAGFNDVAVSTHYGYDFTNFLRWHREGKPTGHSKSSVLGDLFETNWRASVEERGFGDLITVVANKSDAPDGEQLN